MAVLNSVYVGQSGVNIAVEYNTGNKRITQISWNVPSGFKAMGKVWSSGNLVYENTQVGPATGSQNVPGNIQLTEIVENGETTLVYPDNISYEISVQSV